MGGTQFNPDKDIPDLTGKVIFVTGGTAGLGKAFITTISNHHPEHIYFSGRNSKSATAVISDIRAAVPDVNITFVECDLASLASVKEAATRFISESQRLDILVCNAGIMAVGPALTKDGYELQFGTNHLGHALLIKLLLPTLLRTAAEPVNSDVRIVSLTSIGFTYSPSGGIQFKDLRTTQESPMGPWLRYGQSKLANILYAAEIARHYPTITTVSVHPGVIATDLVEKLSFPNRALVYLTNIGGVKTLEEGVYNHLWAATTKKANIKNGEFYVPVGLPGKHTKKSQSDQLAGELWEWTQKQLEEYNE